LNTEQTGSHPLLLYCCIKSRKQGNKKNEQLNRKNKPFYYKTSLITGLHSQFTKNNEIKKKTFQLRNKQCESTVKINVILMTDRPVSSNTGRFRTRGQQD
jgi:hypothetical protein